MSMFLLGPKLAQTFLVDLDRERVQPVKSPGAIAPAFDSWQSGFENQTHWQALLDGLVPAPHAAKTKQARLAANPQE